MSLSTECAGPLLNARPANGERKLSAWRKPKVWAVVRQFTTIGNWLPERDDGVPLTTTRMPGSEEYQIGCRRVTQLGNAIYVEELNGIDDVTHELNYALISYPGATNPFPYSLINFQGKVIHKDVSLGNSTFIQWSGTFETEPEGKETMVNELEAWLRAAIFSLARYLQTNGTGKGNRYQV
ncbi:hypothetical protein WJX73_010356 [Symbiochloris irregularis]|uniref:SRPBCC family protein n=1 Tax=Symbiochloris irregularis TaxID=706552 RepID=A0AAW1P0I6_9CHLO